MYTTTALRNLDLTHYYVNLPLLLTTTYSLLLLLTTTYYYLLLLITTNLLFTTTYYLLLTTTYSYYYLLLLRTTTYYYLLLLTTCYSPTQFGSHQLRRLVSSLLLSPLGHISSCTWPAAAPTPTAHRR